MTKVYVLEINEDEDGYNMSAKDAIEAIKYARMSKNQKFNAYVLSRGDHALLIIGAQSKKEAGSKLIQWSMKTKDNIIRLGESGDSIAKQLEIASKL